MRNPNERARYGRDADQRQQYLRNAGRNEERWDDARNSGAYGTQDRGYDEQDYRPEARFQDYDDERNESMNYRGGQSRGFDQERFESGGYYGGAREYGSGSRQYRGGEQSRPLYSSQSRGGQPYGGQSYEWRQGQGRNPGNRQNWQSQSGYYRARDFEEDDNRYYPGSYYGEDYDDRAAFNPGSDYGYRARGQTSQPYGQPHGQSYGQRQQGVYSGQSGGYGQGLGGDYYGQNYARDRSGYGQQDMNRGQGYGRSGAEGVYGYGTSAYGQPGLREDAYGREFSASQQGYQGQGYQGQSQRGRGPKNYSRSDERIREDISEQLSSHHYIDASEVNVEVKSGVVTLTGSVEQRHQKHEIEDMAESCSGVKDVENRLSVSTRSYASGKSGQQTTTGNKSSESATTDNTSKKH